MALDKESFTSAKNTVMTQMAAGTTDAFPTGAAVGKNLFKSYLPNATDVVSIAFGGGGDVQNTWNHEARELRMDSDIYGIFRTEDRADQFLVLAIGVMPIRLVRNVTWYRLRGGGQGRVEPELHRIAKDTKERVYWAVRIGCELIFDTTTH